MYQDHFGILPSFCYEHLDITSYIDSSAGYDLLSCMTNDGVFNIFITWWCGRLRPVTTLFYCSSLHICLCLWLLIWCLFNVLCSCLFFLFIMLCWFKMIEYLMWIHLYLSSSSKIPSFYSQTELLTCFVVINPLVLSAKRVDFGVFFFFFFFINHLYPAPPGETEDNSVVSLVKGITTGTSIITVIIVSGASLR